MATSDCNLSPEGEFSMDDCDALMQFPYQDYVQNGKDEKNNNDLPELGLSANLSLLGNDETFFSDDNSQEKEHTTSQPVFGAAFRKKAKASLLDPSTIEKCLSLNMTLQQKMIFGMAKLVDALAKNKIKQDDIIQKIKNEEKLKTSGKSRVTKPVSLFAAPYFRDSRGMVPPDNQDAVIKKNNYDPISYLRPPRPWTLAEKDLLMNGIGANALSYVLKPYKTKRDFLKSKMKNKNVTDAEIANLKKQVIRIERKMRMESERPYKDIIKEANGYIDWMTISATNMEGLRSEGECELMWNNYLSIFINKERFTDAEDAMLKQLVDKYKCRNWESIAEELNTNRSPVQCFERYQTKLNKNKLKKFFTPEEDNKLLKLIELYRIGKFIPWNKICGFMDGRTRHQVINRYERTLCHDLKRGPWAIEEDAMILACIGKFGKHWTRMQEFLPGRSSYNIRERYVGHLDPDLRIGNWSRSEDIELIKMIKKHGYGKWGVICKGLPGRTDNMCLCRARRLMIQSLAVSKSEDVKWGYDKIEEIVSMLKPVASSKTCIAQNNRLRDAQNRAKDTLKSGLEKVAQRTGEIIDLEELDMSQISSNTLRLLAKEFSKSDTKTEITVWQPKYLPTNYVYKHERQMFVSRTSKRKRSYNYASGDNSEGSDNDIFYARNENGDDENFRLSYTDKIWLEKVLDAKFKDEASINFNNNSKEKKSICLNGKESMECSVYQAYIQKELKCHNYLGEDVDNFVCGKVDYNVALGQISQYFIQPRTSERETLVLPPNFNTLHGFDMIIRSGSRLRRSACFAEHSLPYIRYVSGFESEPPKCIACTMRDGTLPTRNTYEKMVQSMKNKLLVVDDIMEKAAMIETRQVDATDLPCKCEVMAKSKAQLDLMAKRFISMFMWPFMLNQAGVSKEQEQLVYKKNPIRYDVNQGLRGRGRPPKRKSTNSTNHSPTKKVKSEESSNVEKTSPTNRKPSRRSTRACVLERKSFSTVVIKEEES